MEETDHDQEETIMSKKFLIGLTPLLATVAFMVIPAASQAEPHVYKNGLIGAEGKKVREIAWGTLKLNNSTLGEVECHNVFAGYAENPAGGGAAKGQVQGFYPYECVDATCTTVLGGKAIHVTPGKLPWSAVVFENAKKEFRQKTGHKGPTKNVKPNEITEPEFIDFTVNCEGVTTPEFFGEQDPLLQNNAIAIGAGPGEEQLEAESVNPESKDLESELVGTGSTTGKVKVEGYGAEEELEVKNP
jgi:hypothetical protein